MNRPQIAQFLGTALMALAICLACVSARAQPALPSGATSGVANPGAPVIGGGGKAATGKLPPPPALPGSRVEKDEPAPAQRPAAEMSPTDALFDAINRGDMAGVRDAMARGADLNGTNILGLTPIDLSVDLGRNEITFLLLSLRGAVVSSAPPVTPAADVFAKPQVKKKVTQAAANQRRAPASSPEDARLVPVRSANESVVSSVPINPGTPVPQAGFLGFGPPQATAQP